MKDESLCQHEWRVDDMVFMSKEFRKITYKCEKCCKLRHKGQVLEWVDIPNYTDELGIT